MIDINQGWDVATATHMVEVLRQFPLAWIEEPLAADRPASRTHAFRKILVGETSQRLDIDRPIV